ncbi:MAG: M17 family peptidase N-terminal domain-containing protein, partial [Pontimonas sp.]
MTVPTPVFLESSDSLDAADILVVGLRKASDGPRVYAPGLPEDAVSALEALAHAIDAEGAVDSASRQGSPSELAIRSVLFTGLGDGEITPDLLREAAGYASLQVSKGERLVFALGESGPELEAVVEGALLGAHRVSKPGTTSEMTAPTHAFLGELAADSVTRILVGVTAVWQVRDLVTM